MTQLYVDTERIQREVENTSRWLKDTYSPTFVGILTGAATFTVDLARTFARRCRVDFVRVKTYADRYAVKKPKIDAGLSLDVKGRSIVLVEDIIDTGATVDAVIKYLRKQKPAHIKLVALFGDMARKFDVDDQRFLFPLPDKDKYVFGYGMDDSEYYREVRNIWITDR